MIDNTWLVLIWNTGQGSSSIQQKFEMVHQHYPQPHSFDDTQSALYRDLSFHLKNIFLHLL